MNSIYKIAGELSQRTTKALLTQDASPTISDVQHVQNYHYLHLANASALGMVLHQCVRYVSKNDTEVDAQKRNEDGICVANQQFSR